MKKINLALLSFTLFATLFMPSYVSAQLISPAASGASPSSTTTTTSNAQTSPTTNNQSTPQANQPTTSLTNSQPTQSTKHDSKPTAIIAGAVIILGLLVITISLKSRRKPAK